jgi:sulfate transport system permease protein
MAAPNQRGMGSSTLALPRPAAFRRPRLGGDYAQRGLVTLWLSVMVLLPIAALVTRSFDDGAGEFWQAVTQPAAIDALQLTLVVSLAIVLINMVMGTLIAWVLVRDEFPGKGILNSIIDLPFALPTIVAGLTLIALYGSNGVLGLDNFVAAKLGVITALLFVTLPFVVRAVQPTLLELDRDMEEASASLGAGPLTTFRRIVLPNLAPAVFAGAALAFARAVGEFGSLILIAKATQEVASIYIFKQVEGGNVTGAAAVSVVLLLISLVVLFGINFLGRRSVKYDR